MGGGSVLDRSANPSPEELFRRYRRGDARALGRLFDTVSPELFRIALRLSEDAAAAEDALQDTWLAALEAEGEVRSVVPWLVGILKNKVRRIRRTERRRPVAGVAGELLEDEPVDAAQREEALREVRAALDDLPETYREVAVLRWRYGLDPSEIADARGMPPGTVRSLLSRAAEKLRSRLGALTIAAGIPTSRGLSSVRQAVLAKAGAGAATTAVSVTGALLVSKKIAVVAVLLLVLGAGWITLRDRAGKSPPPPETPAPRDTAPEVARADSAERSETVTAPSAETAGSASRTGEDAAGTARVTVRWPDGTPAAGVFVKLIAWDGPDPLNHTIELPTDHHGRLVATGLAGGRITAYVDRGGSRSAVLGSGGSIELTLALEEANEVEGVVVDPAGRPVEAAAIWLSDYGNHTAGRIVARSGPDGTFRIRAVGDGHYVGARAAGFAPSGLTYVRGTAGETFHARLVLEGPGGEVSGVVRRPDGAPVAGARVRVGPAAFRNVILEDGTGVPASPALEVRTGLDGDFRVEGVPPGAVVVLVRAEGFAPRRDPLELRKGESRKVEIVLEPGVTVQGVVTDRAGRTVPAARISVGSYAEFLSSYVQAGPDGSFRLAGLSAGAISIRAGRKGVGAATLNARSTPGQVIAWNPVLKQGDGIRGTVVDESGAPRVGWLVRAYERTRSTTWRGSGKTGDDGGFEIPNCPESPLRVDVYAPDGRRHCLLPSASVLDPVIGGPPLRIVVPESALPSASVTGFVTAPDGTPVGGAEVHVRHLDTGFAPGLRTETDGRFRAGPLPKGVYVIEVQAKGWPAIRLGQRSLVAGEVLDLGRLELEEGGEVVARVRRSDGTPLESASAWCELIDGRGTGTVFLPLSEGKLRSGPLTPGAYMLRVEGLTRGGAEVAQIPVEIRRGETEDIDVDLEPSTRVVFRIHFPEGAPETATTRLRIRDDQGRLVRDLRAFAMPSLSLLPGSYRVEAVNLSGLRGEATVEVGPPGGGNPDPIPIHLR